MRIHVDLRDDFGHNAFLLFEEKLSEAYPESARTVLASDIKDLLRAFGGIVLAVVADAGVEKRGGRKPVIDELARTLRDFSLRQVRGDAA